MVSEFQEFCFGCGADLIEADDAPVSMCRACRDRYGTGALYTVRGSDGGRHGPFPKDGIVEQLHKNFLSEEDSISTPGMPFVPLSEHVDFAAWFLPGDSRLAGRDRTGTVRARRRADRRRRAIVVQVMALIGIFVFGALPVVANRSGVTRLPQPWLDWIYQRIEGVHEFVLVDVFGVERKKSRVTVQGRRQEVPGRDVVKALKVRFPEAVDDPLALVDAGWLELGRDTQSGAEAAVEHLERAAATIPGDSGATGGLALAYLRLAEGDEEILANSQVLMDRAVFLRPEHSATWRAMAGIALTRENFRSALSYTEKCLELSGRDRQCLLWHGQSLLGLGLLDEAGVWLNRRIDALPDTSGTALLLGRIALLEGRYGSALSALEPIVEKEPEHAMVWRFLTEIFYKAGDLKQARIAAERAVELNPSFFEERLLHARLLLQVEGAAEESLERLLSLLNVEDLAPEFRSRVLLSASQAARASGRFEEAVEHAQQSLESREGWGPGKLALAMGYAKLGNTGAASKALLSVDAHTLEGREGARFHYWVARFQMSEGRYRIAQESLERAREFDPQWGPIAVSMVHIDLKVGRRDQVIQDLSEGFLLDIEGEVLREPLVMNWYPSLAHDQAYQRLVDSFGRDPLHMYDLSRLMGQLRIPECLRTGECDEAKLFLLDALKQNQLDSVVLGSLGRVLLRQGEGMEALSFLERSLAIREGEPLFHVLRGRALLKLGEYDRAADAFKRAYTYDLDHGAAHRHHAEVLFLSGRHSEAARHVRDVQKVDPLDRFTRGLILEYGQ